MSPPALTASPSTQARTGRKVRVANATPDVARMLRDLGLSWMLEGAPRALEAANEPMRRIA